MVGRELVRYVAVRDKGFRVFFEVRVIIKRI